jgi:predicted alpha/beta superfamily hydrolase
MITRSRISTVLVPCIVLFGGLTGAAAVPRAVRAQAAPAQAPVPGPPLARTGTIKRHGNFPSRLVDPRNIDVWLPPDYNTTGRKYAVVYVQDGQNAFDPATSFGGVDWGIDETMTRLLTTDSIRPAIIVAIWNTPKRMLEYMPRKAIGTDTSFTTGLTPPTMVTGPLLSDAYLRFITTELKPFIDRTYRTRPDRSDTFIMGSSMGGLISLYAISELPGIFGGAASLSTHWPAADGRMVEYLRNSAPNPSEHRIYFDHGTATLDSLYGPYQERVDAIMRGHKYVEGKNFVSLVFDGADHSERAWRQRVDVVLKFLLGK